MRKRERETADRPVCSCLTECLSRSLALALSCAAAFVRFLHARPLLANHRVHFAAAELPCVCVVCAELILWCESWKLGSAAHHLGPTQWSRALFNAMVPESAIQWKRSIKGT